MDSATHRSAPRSRRRDFLLLIIAVLFAGLLVEGGLRLWAKLSLQQRGLTYHREFGWIGLPNVRKTGQHWGLREAAWTNSRGWRDRETPLGKPDGQRRIVAVGDSFTFGVMADYGERFTELLEERFRALEVVNLGMNAMGPDQQLRILELEGVHYEPDIVVQVAFTGNDFEDIRYERRFGWPKPYYTLEQGRLDLVKPEISWDVRIRTALYVGELVFRVADRHTQTSRLAPDWSDPEADTVPLFLALTRRIKQVATENGARHLLVFAYPRPRYASRRNAIEARALDALDGAGIVVLDTFDLLAARPDHGKSLFNKERHWNVRGHRMLADAIRAEIDRRGWLGSPAGSGDRRLSGAEAASEG